MRRSNIVLAALAAVIVVAAPAESAPRSGASGCDIIGGIDAVVFDPQDSNTVWAHCENDFDNSPGDFGRPSLYRSDDGAQTWNEVPVLPRSWHITTLGVSRTGQELYAGGVGNRYGDVGVWRSLDGGTTWSRLAGWPKTVAPYSGHRMAAIADELAVGPSDPATVYAVIRNVVLRTRDSGRTWVRLGRGLPKYDGTTGDLVLNPKGPKLLYLGTSKGVYRSDDGGNHWRSTSRACTRDCLTRAYGRYPPTHVSLAVDPTRPRRLYAQVNDSPLRSTDGGDRWRRVAFVGWHIAVAKDGSIYAFTSSGISPFAPISVARSTDGGTTWRRTVVLKGHPSGATVLDTGPLAVDPTNPNVALAAVGASDDSASWVCARLLKTENGGRTWQPADRGLVALADRCPLG